MKLPPTASAVPSAVASPVSVSSASNAGVRAPAGKLAQGDIDSQALQQVADMMSQRIGTTGQQLQFSVDSDTGKTVLRVTDAESGTLLRQIPGDEVLAIVRILDRMQGMLIRQKA